MAHGRGPRGGGRGGGFYGFRGGHNNNNNRGGGSASRRGGVDARFASGPFGGATVGVPKKRAKWSGEGNGIEEVDGEGGEDGHGDGNDVVETGSAAKQTGKGKGKGKVK